MRFRIGDIVRISKDTDIDDKKYPNNTNGEVVRIVLEDMYPVKVRFEGADVYNGYADFSRLSENELRLVRRIQRDTIVEENPYRMIGGFMADDIPF